MLIAHLSDLHLRDEDDAVWLDRQLDRIASRHPAHLAVTGDLLDRWQPSLLERALDALEARGFLHASRCTLLYGNHDLASSGGHPRRGTDLWRLASRFWDPPPLIAARRDEFYGAISRRAPGVAGPAPWQKSIDGAVIAVLDTVPAFWLPVSFSARTVFVHHAIGRVPAAQTSWLAALRGGSGPLIVLIHHYPLPVQPFRWVPDRRDSPVMEALRWLQAVEVPMEIEPDDRERLWEQASAAGARLVLCGHVHRVRFDERDGIAVGLNGQSGAAWAGRSIAWYELGSDLVSCTIDRWDGQSAWRPHERTILQKTRSDPR